MLYRISYKPLVSVIYNSSLLFECKSGYTPGDSFWCSPYRFAPKRNYIHQGVLKMQPSDKHSSLTDKQNNDKKLWGPMVLAT